MTTLVSQLAGRVYPSSLLPVINRLLHPQKFGGKFSGPVIQGRDLRQGVSMAIATKMPLPGCFLSSNRLIPQSSKSGRMAWSIRSAADGGRLNSSTNDTGGTRLIKAIKAFQVKLNARINELRKNLPTKLLFFLVGFYCATAFATVIGQTGDWDVLSAALAVAVVEGIGALMYKSSLPLSDNLRNLITMGNYWKAGLSLGLFLDSFKY